MRIELERRARQSSVFAVVSPLLALALTGTATAQLKPEEAIKFRQSGYAFMSWNMGKLKGMLVDNPASFNKEQAIAAANLIRRMGAEVYEAAAIIDLPELGGSQKLQDAGIPTFSLTAFALDEQ